MVSAWKVGGAGIRIIRMRSCASGTPNYFWPLAVMFYFGSKVSVIFDCTFLDAGVVPGHAVNFNLWAPRASPRVVRGWFTSWSILDALASMDGSFSAAGSEVEFSSFLFVNIHSSSLEDFPSGNLFALTFNIRLPGAS